MQGGCYIGRQPSARMEAVATFNDQFDHYGAWRRELALRLKLLREWLDEHDLNNEALLERLRRLEEQVRSDRIVIAFVAEFSRGKSELINAIFFGEYGRRIMPATVGRTTMCPTELAYEAGSPPSLRLLPIETRKLPRTFSDLRSDRQIWHRVDLNLRDPEALAATMAHVADVRKVSVDEARALGFWSDDEQAENPACDAQGMVEVPRWRHALINIAHPLLKQGLVIIDTPGLNAIGTEPELTVNLIPSANAVVFVLAADTGVTKSDLGIWREYLKDQDSASTRLVVLNKIDTIWDGINTNAQIDADIARQVSTTAQTLGIDAELVLPVSAQKGLLAKIEKNEPLLLRSRLPTLEGQLAHGVLHKRQEILQANIVTGLAALRHECDRLITVRRRDLADQLLELRSLRGKNDQIIGNMRTRVEVEEAEFNHCVSRIQAVKSVQLKLLRDVMQSLGSAQVKQELQQLFVALRQKGIKLGVRSVYGETFGRLRATLEGAKSSAGEIQAMLTATFRQLNAEYGFSLQAPALPDLDRCLSDLAMVEAGHLKYLGLTGVLKLSQPEFVERLVRALMSRLRAVYEVAQSELDLWSRASMVQMDVQLRERRKSFERRAEAIDRIRRAATGLDDRISEIDSAQQGLDRLATSLTGITEQFSRSGFGALSANNPTNTSVEAAAEA